MQQAPGAQTFRGSGDAYDRFMGRYSLALAPLFLAFADVPPGDDVVDVGCGPGALTGVLVGHAGAEHVHAIDPSPSFVAACRERLPEVDVRSGRAEELPYADGSMRAALAQLVLHFVSDPVAAVAEMSRVVRPGGVVAVCVWDASGGMELLSTFERVISVVDPASVAAAPLRFGGDGEVATILRDGGLSDVSETSLTVQSRYSDFDELWDGLLEGQGPAGERTLALAPVERSTFHDRLWRAFGAPEGEFTLSARARAARGRVS